MNYFLCCIFVCGCVFASESALELGSDSLSVDRALVSVLPDSFPNYYDVILDIPESNFHIEWRHNNFNQIAWTDGNQLSTNAPVEFFHNSWSHLYDSLGCWHTFHMPHFPVCVLGRDHKNRLIHQKCIITPGVEITREGIYYHSDEPIDLGTVLDQIPLSLLKEFSQVLKDDLNYEDFCETYPMHEDLIKGIIAKGQGLPFIPKPFVKPLPKALVKLADFLKPVDGDSEKE